MEIRKSLKTLIVLGLMAICTVVFLFLGPYFGLPVSYLLLIGLSIWWKEYNLMLAVLSGGLLSLGWPDIGSAAPVLFVALVPLLYAEHRISKDGKPNAGRRVFGIAYVAFFTFNGLTGWWVYYASETGVAMEVILNALFMTVVFRLFHAVKMLLGDRVGYLGLLFLWLGFEYMHLNWDLSYPWMNLGNGWANYPSLIQWYSLTGAAGGTLWILALNILILHLLIAVRDEKRMLFGPKKTWAGIIALVVIPVVASLIIYTQYEESGEQVEVVVVQPNIDPYNGKFQGDWSEQLTDMLALGEAQLTPETKWLVFPETAIQEGAYSPRSGRGDSLQFIGLWEGHLENSRSVTMIREFLEKHPQLNILIGMTSFGFYPDGEGAGVTSRRYGESEDRYDVYNSALFINKSSEPESYFKSKPLIGVEYMPFAFIFKPLEDFVFDMGGTTGSLGTQDYREVFSDPDSTTKVAPVICYESVYGEFVGEFVREEEANLLFIITNDGWWGDTPGYKQHLHYASLRAIENRRSVARSANTGTSAFINQRGDISEATEWWVPDARRAKLTVNEEKTLYTRLGDYIGRTSGFVAVFLLLYFLMVKIRRRSDPLSKM